MATRFKSCTGRVCPRTGFSLLRGARTGYQNSRETRLCGNGMSPLTRDHEIIPNHAQSRGKNPEECPGILQVALNSCCPRDNTVFYTRALIHTTKLSVVFFTALHLSGNGLPGIFLLPEAFFCVVVGGCGSAVSCPCQACTPRTDHLPTVHDLVFSGQIDISIHDLYDLSDLARVAAWEPFTCMI